MSYINDYLEECFAYGFEGGPEFRTQIVELQNGRERRNSVWSQQKHKYTASFQNLEAEQYKNIKQMHVVARGMAKAFKIIDHLDYEADNDVFGEGDGVQRIFQLSRTSTIAGVSYTRQIFGVVENDNFFLTINNVINEDYEIDYLRGTITFTTPPIQGAILRWSGNFFVWVRFNQDDLPFTLDAPNARNGQVSFIEVAPPPIGMEIL